MTEDVADMAPATSRQVTGLPQVENTKDMAAYKKRASSAFSDYCSEMGVTTFSPGRETRDASNTSENFSKAVLLSKLLNNNKVK